jgi:hypothetical protein
LLTVDRDETQDKCQSDLFKRLSNRIRLVLRQEVLQVAS